MTRSPTGTLALTLLGLAPPTASHGAGPAAAPAPPARLLVYECVMSGNRDVCVVPVEGGASRRLTTHPADDMWPRFMPGGREVVFSSDRSGTWQLWRVDLASGAETRVRAHAAREWQAAPAHDGRSVAFVSDTDGHESLRVAPLAGRSSGPGRLILTHGARAVLGNPDWAGAGRRIVFSSTFEQPGHAVYLLDADTGEARRISPRGSGACEPRVGRDGRKVAYVRRRRATRERSAIVEHDLETGAEHILVDWPALNYGPAWSPDGGELVFSSTVEAAGADGPALHRLRLSDGKSWRVTRGHPAYHPDYQPD